jgi:signal transduction histidine kinase
VLLLASGTAYLLSSSFAAARQARHSDEVRVALGELLTTVVDAETGERGYLVTGDREFMAPYQRALGSWRPELDEVLALTRDEPRQQARLTELDHLVEDRFDLLQRTTALYEGGQRDSELVPAMLRGKERMDEMRQLVSEIDAEEEHLADVRARDVAVRSELTMALVLTGTAAFGGVVSTVMLKRQLSEERRQRAEETLAFAEQFVGILGHDLRSPLNAVKMSAHLLARAEVSPSQHAKYVQRILNSTDRMTRMIGQLLDLARIRLGKGIPVEPVRTDMGSIVTSVVDELRTANPSRSIEYIRDVDVMGACDRDRFAQVVSNLVGNALEHGDPTQPVGVTLRASADDVELAVHNSGPPIPPQVLPLLFNPYRRGVRASSYRPGGLGLGLFISEQIARAHGGLIQACSSAENGTTFTVSLPRLSVVVPDAAGHVRTAAHSP